MSFEDEQQAMKKTLDAAGRIGPVMKKRLCATAASMAASSGDHGRVFRELMSALERKDPPGGDDSGVLKVRTRNVLMPTTQQ